MRLFGLEVTRAKAHVPGPRVTQTVADNRGGWFRIFEPFGGAWQRNIEWTRDTVLAHHAVYTCITLIASDIGKLRPRIVQQDNEGVWQETTLPDVSDLLRHPNPYQNHIQFKEWWVTSKLTRGNTYAFKKRLSGSDVIQALYLLDPDRVTVLVAPDGSVFYQIQADNLSGLEEAVTVPASEIIHDRMNCLSHPLVGVSPIFASGMAANIGLKIQNNSAAFFGSGSNPSGVLTVPTKISQEQADKLSEQWNEMASAANSGVVPVLPEGMEFKPLRMTAVDSQMIEHLQWTAETIASTFHVPKFKIGVGQQPTYQNGEILNQQYYSDCLQSHIEQMEACLDDGLGLMRFGTLGVELDLDGLLRMDTATQVEVLAKASGGAFLTPDEARAKFDKRSLPGGGTLYRQQQEYSIAALNKRDTTEVDADHDVQADALNGAQITALQGLVAAAALGEIPLDTVEAVIGAAFPLLTPAQIEAIVAPLKDVEPPPDPPPEPEPDDDDELERFIALRARTLRLKAAA